MANAPLVLAPGPEGAPPWAPAASDEPRLLVGRAPVSELRDALRAAGCALIDGGQPEAVAIAQRVRSLDPLIQLVIVTPAAERATIERSVLFSPGLGEVWIVPPEEVDRSLTERATRVTEQRRSYRATHSRIEHELSAIEPHLPRRALISDAYLAALLVALPDPVVSIDDEGKILTWNTAAERVLGRSREAALGRILSEVLDMEPTARLEELLGVWPDERGLSRGEIRYRVDPDDPRVAELAVVPVEAGGHRVRAVLIHDVTEERRLAQAREAQAAELEMQAEELQSQATQLEEAQVDLERVNRALQEVNTALAEQAAEAESARAEAESARREAEAANRAKSEFLATMSHEIRTPINAIVGYTDLLSLGISGPVTAHQEAQLARVRSSSEHLLMLIEDILDLAKVEAGRLQVAHERLPAIRAVAAALALVGPQADEKGVAVEDACSDAGTIEYVGDEDRVRQILVNLLSNAVKFTPEGGRVRVACSTTNKGSPTPELEGGPRWTCIRVEDTGIGIAADELERIFDPFVQADGGLTRKSGGTGLGLTISRQLALLMGGDLTVESEVGAGSTFTLWLPSERVLTPSLDETLRSARRTTPHEIAGIAEIGRALRNRLDRVLESYLARIAQDGRLPMAAAHDRRTLEDHMATLLTDLAQTLVVLGDEDETVAAVLRDGTEIQRAISELHGAQRARIGWREDALRREFEILGEVLRSAMRDACPEPRDLTEPLRLLDRSLEHAQRASLRGFRRELAEGSRAKKGARETV